MQGVKQRQGNEEVREETISFRLIEDLQKLGINVADIKKLQEAGYTTIGSLLQSSSRELVNIKGLSEAKVEKIRETAKKLDMRGRTLLSIFHKLMQRCRVTI